MFEMKGTPIYRFLAAFYVIIITYTFYSDTMLPKISSMMIIPVAFICLLVLADFNRIKTIGGYPAWYAAGICIVLVQSLGIWIANIEASIYITEGTQRILFQLINLIVSFSAVYIFGSRAIDLTLYGAIAMNTIRAALGVMKFGIGRAISDFINTLITGEQLGFMSFMEIHVVTYVYGIFIIYYLFVCQYNLKSRLIHAGLATFFLVLGWKRIIFASVFLGVAVMFILTRFKGKARTRLCMICGTGVAVLCFLYVPFIRYGLFEYVMNMLEVETNTRIEIYNYVKPLYEFTPKYIGRGVDYIVRYLLYLKSLGVKYAGSSLDYIHNDILVHYIEKGFIGFTAWLYCNCIFSMRWFKKHVGTLAMALFCSTNMYSFINYSVGNTSRAYAVRLTLSVVLIGTISLFKTELSPTEVAKIENPPPKKRSLFAKKKTRIAR